MSPNYLTYCLFVLTCFILLTLPFIPAFSEWLRPTDLASLPIAVNYSSQTDYFAKRLHADVAAKSGLGLSTGYEDFDYVMDRIENMNWTSGKKRLISPSSIDSPIPIRTSQALYVAGDIRTVGGSSFNALYADGDIILGSRSEVLDWAHATGTLRLGQDCVALRRISADVAIELDNEVWFERLQAPTLRFGLIKLHKFETSSINQAEGSFSDLPNAKRQTANLHIVRGDCTLPSNTIYRGSLIVTGFLTIGSRTTVIGDIKARGGASVGSSACVQGAITCEKRVYIYKNASAYGPIVAETDVLVGVNAVIGLLKHPTTITARNIILESGSIVHGTVWAREIGMVKTA